MVGSYVGKVFSPSELYLSDKTSLDITDANAVFQTVERVQPTHVLHLAAATDVDRCEQNPDFCFRTNVIGTQNIALACQRFNAIMVYISTCGVFDGKQRQAHTEFDIPNPPNVYSRSKLEGEKVVQSLLQRYFIVRAGWVTGGGKEGDKKFVGKMIKLCLERNSVEAVDDKVGTLDYAPHFLKTLRELIQTPYYGLYHIANRGVCSRYDVTKEIVRLLNRNTKVTSVSSDRFPQPAARSDSEALRNYKLELMGMDTMPTWQEALQEYINEVCH